MKPATFLVLALLALAPACGDPPADLPAPAGPPGAVEAQAAPAADGPAADAPAGDDPAQPDSLLAHPLYLDPEPPPVHSAALIRLVFAGAPGVSLTVQRTREETAALAEDLARQLRAGASFAELARRWSSDRSAPNGGIWGSYTPGVLSGPLDEFLFSAEIGDVSQPFALSSSYSILQRIETHAAARTIFVAGATDAARSRCAELWERARAGEDFAALAREASEDPASAARGGALAIFERGRNDALVKQAAFELPIGGLSEPIESPLGWHLVQRVPLAELDPALAEPTLVRARAILIQHVGAVEAPAGLERSPAQAEREIRILFDRVQAGEDMSALSDRYNEDRGARARGGDLGWLHRLSPQVPSALDGVFLVPAGGLLEPLHTPVGWILMRRES